MKPPGHAQGRRFIEKEKELEKFRQEAQRLNAGRKSGSLPFPETLHGFAVRYAEEVGVTRQPLTRLP